MSCALLCCPDPNDDAIMANETPGIYEAIIFNFWDHYHAYVTHATASTSSNNSILDLFYSGRIMTKCA